MSLAIDITGERFGNLVALHPLRSTRRGLRWLFACDCGGIAERFLASMMAARAAEMVSQCDDCLQTLRSKNYTAACRRSAYSKLWQQTGSLWSAASDERLIRNVARALRRAGWRPPSEYTGPIPTFGFDLADAIDMSLDEEYPGCHNDEAQRRQRAQRLWRDAQWPISAKT